jgi:hypothetical protein
MYEEYLGNGYHDEVRKRLTCNNELLPNSIIDADVNIGAMKALMQQAFNKFNYKNQKIDSEEKLTLVKNIAINYLCAILCVAMRSRTSAKPFNLEKYKKDWGKKREKYVTKGNDLLRILVS